MNEFRYPVTEDLPGLRRLWKLAFGEEGAFVDLFFDQAFSSRRCRVAVTDGELSGMLYWFDCELSGKKVAYLYAVATDLAFQGKGIASGLLRDTHEYLRERGYSAAVLVPVTADLFPFYERLGYRTGGRIRETLVSPGESVSVRRISREEFAALRKRYLPEKGIRQEGENLALLSGYAEFYAGDDFTAVVAREPKPICLELLGGDCGPELAAALGVPELTVRMPGAGRDFAMGLSLKPGGLPEKFYFGLAFD